MNAEPRSALSEGAEGAFAALVLVFLVRHQAPTTSDACAGLGRVLAGALAARLALDRIPGWRPRRRWGAWPLVLAAALLLLVVPCGDGSLVFWQILVGGLAGWAALGGTCRPFPRAAGRVVGVLLALGWETGRIAASSLASAALVLGLLSARGGFPSCSGAEAPAGSRPRDEVPHALLLFVLAFSGGLWLVLAPDFLFEGGTGLAALVLALAFVPWGEEDVVASRPDLARQVLLAGLMLSMAVIWRFRAALHPLCEAVLLPWLWAGAALPFFRRGLREELRAGGGPLAGGAVALAFGVAPVLVAGFDPSVLLAAGAVMTLLLAWAVVPTGEGRGAAFFAARGLALAGAGLMLVALYDGLEELRRPGRRTSLDPRGEFVALQHVGTGPGRLVVGRGVGGTLLASRGRATGRLDDPLRAEGGLAAMLGAWLAPRRGGVALLGPRAVFAVPAFLDMGFEAVRCPEPDGAVRGLLRGVVRPEGRRRLHLVDADAKSFVGSGAFRGLDLVVSTFPEEDLSPSVFAALSDGLAPFGILIQQVDESIGRKGMARLAAAWRRVLDEGALLRAEGCLLLVGGRRGSWDTPRPVLRFRALDWPAANLPWTRRHRPVLEVVTRLLATTGDLDELLREEEPWSRIRRGGGPVPVWARAMCAVDGWCEGGGERDLRFAGIGVLRRGTPPARLEGSGMDPQLLEADGRRLVQPRVWMAARCAGAVLRWIVRPIPGPPFEEPPPSRSGMGRILLPCLGRERAFRIELSSESFRLVGEWDEEGRSLAHEIRVEAPRDRGGELEDFRALLARLDPPDGQI